MGAKFPPSVTSLSPAEMPEMVTVPLPWPQATILPSGLQAPAPTTPGCVTSADNRPESAFQILMAPSLPQAATREPSKLKATEMIGDLCPRKTWSSCPDSEFQIRT